MWQKETPKLKQERLDGHNHFKTDHKSTEYFWERLQNHKDSL